MRQGGVRAWLLAVLALGAALTGCGDDGQLLMSSSEVEAFVESDPGAVLPVSSTSFDDTEVAPTIEDVKCDGGLEAEFGDRVTCSVTMMDGDEAKAFGVVVEVGSDGADGLVPGIAPPEQALGDKL